MHELFKQDDVILAGSDILKVDRTLKLMIALFVIMPTHYLDMEICNMKQTYLRSIPNFLKVYG